MNQNPYEVVIVGAGPAGLTACFWLQKLGIKHLLLEKENFPRDKACGDIINSMALRALYEIDPEIVPGMFEKGLLTPISGAKLSTQKDQFLTLKYKWLDNKEGVPSCFSVKRSEFDLFLLRKLSENPLTEIRTACAVSSIKVETDRVEIKTQSGELILSQMLLLGTGSNANPLGKQLTEKQDHHSALGLRAYYKGLSSIGDKGELFLDEKLMPGGMYIAPLSHGLFNVNLVVRQDVVRKKNMNLNTEFERMLSEHPGVSPLFAKARRIGNPQGSRLVLGTKKRKIVGDRYMLIGDSAGLIDLISANGIPQAVLSGKLAALKAKECLTNQNFSEQYLMSYQRELLSKVKNDLSIGRVLNPFLGSAAFNSVLFSFVKWISSASVQRSSLSKIFYHKRPYLLLLNPVFYFQLIKESLFNHGPARASR